MSKKSRKILAIVAAMVAVVSLFMLIAPTHNFSSKIHTVVETTDQGAEPSTFQTNLTVNRSDKYVISANWWQEETPWFVTGLIVTDEKGNRVYTVTGGMLTSESKEMELEKGKYSFKFTALGTHEAYEKYVKENFPGEEVGDIDASYFKPGTYEMDYRVEILQSMGNAYAIGMVLGVTMGILIVALILVAARKENAAVHKYDERQIAVQGKAYKYGFFTMAVYYILLFTSMEAHIEIPCENSLLVFMGFGVGVVVFAAYSIMKDAYFRLDENKGMLIIMFTLLAILNLVAGIAKLVRGSAITEGRLTFIGASNLVCGILLVFLLAVIMIKRFKDKEEE